MYFEVAKVKTYFRTYKKKKVPFNQIHLGKDSKFNKDTEEEEVAVVKLQDFKDLIEQAKNNDVKELKAKVESVENEKQLLQQELKQLKEDNEKLTSDIILLQQEHKEEVAELNFKLNNEKDYSKALLVVINDLFKRNAFNRLRNKETESYIRVVKLKQLPENEVETEAKDVKAEE